ncbi:MAG TPA: DNA polymerase III [Candidatus Treponema faecavium]|nr:DNA polymerase III [Candidatus Treponema faecavium]
MFENLLYQNAAAQLSRDIEQNRLPNAVLLSGPAASGKLTCALELARVLSCRSAERGLWQCTCSSCLLHKSLVSPDAVLTGPRDCLLEIAAAADTLRRGISEHAPWLMAARYLFIRSVRKLTVRFSPVLLAEDDKASKIAVIVSAVHETIEELDPHYELPAADRAEKIIEEAVSLCKKLETGFMYDSLPVSHVRCISQWARYTAGAGKKLVIIENADRMQESVRNALLKILEEPPEDTVFVLTALRRNAVMPTILSRVRPYLFADRTAAQQKEVISRVFHAEYTETGEAAAETEQNHGISSFLQRFLPVPVQDVYNAGAQFMRRILRNGESAPEAVYAACSSFEPRQLLVLFCQGISGELKQMQLNPSFSSAERSCLCEAAAGILRAVRGFYANITVYNQNPISALELLRSDICRELHRYRGGLPV